MLIINTYFRILFIYSLFFSFWGQLVGTVWLAQRIGFLLIQKVIAIYWTIITINLVEMLVFTLQEIAQLEKNHLNMLIAFITFLTSLLLKRVGKSFLQNTFTRPKSSESSINLPFTLTPSRALAKNCSFFRDGLQSWILKAVRLGNFLLVLD